MAVSLISTILPAALLGIIGLNEEDGALQSERLNIEAAKIEFPLLNHCQNDVNMLKNKIDNERVNEHSEIKKIFPIEIREEILYYFCYRCYRLTEDVYERLKSYYKLMCTEEEFVKPTMKHINDVLKTVQVGVALKNNSNSISLVIFANFPGNGNTITKPTVQLRNFENLLIWIFTTILHYYGPQQIHLIVDATNIANDIQNESKMITEYRNNAPHQISTTLINNSSGSVDNYNTFQETYKYDRLEGHENYLPSNYEPKNGNLPTIEEMESDMKKMLKTSIGWYPTAVCPK